MGIILIYESFDLQTESPQIDRVNDVQTSCELC